jgi:hypothetical protein
VVVFKNRSSFRCPGGGKRPSYRGNTRLLGQATDVCHAKKMLIYHLDFNSERCKDRATHTGKWPEAGFESLTVMPKGDSPCPSHKIQMPHRAAAIRACHRRRAASPSRRRKWTTLRTRSQVSLAVRAVGPDRAALHLPIPTAGTPSATQMARFGK